MDEFNFYNSENDGYRGSLGGYVDPEPGMPNTPFSTGGMQAPRKKKRGAAKVVALVLACAGLKRLGLEDRISRYFEPEEMIPAAGQGILAVQGRAGEDYSFLDSFKDREGTLCALCERAFVRKLEGGCSSPVAAHAKVEDGRLHVRGLYYDEATKGWLTGEAWAKADEETAEKLGADLAEKLRTDYQAGGR